MQMIYNSSIENDNMMSMFEMNIEVKVTPN